MPLTPTSTPTTSQHALAKAAWETQATTRVPRLLLLLPPSAVASLGLVVARTTVHVILQLPATPRDSLVLPSETEALKTASLQRAEALPVSLVPLAAVASQQGADPAEQALGRAETQSTPMKPVSLQTFHPVPSLAALTA